MVQLGKILPLLQSQKQLAQAYWLTRALFTSFNEVGNIWVEHCNYGDIYYGFGDAGQWKMAEPLVSALSSVDDPRLSLMSKPSPGGTVTVNTSEASDDQIAFLKSSLDNAGLVLDTDYTWTQTAGELTITMAEEHVSHRSSC